MTNLLSNKNVELLFVVVLMCEYRSSKVLLDKLFSQSLARETFYGQLSHACYYISWNILVVYNF